MVVERRGRSWIKEEKGYCRFVRDCDEYGNG